MRPMLIAAAVLIAATPGMAQKRGEVPEATPAGEPVTCLSTSQIRETKVRSDKVIDFVMHGRKVYRNELPHSCPGLASERRFLHRTSLNSYCSTDTITVLYGGGLMPGATCGLGKFQPVTLAN